MQTPYFCIDADKLEDNLRILRGVMDRTGCKILLAQKCFSCYDLYPLIRKYLAGATASGIYEARLCHEHMVTSADAVNGNTVSDNANKSMPHVENHIFSPAYKECDIDEILSICDHIVFNSPRQLMLYGERAKAAGLQVGLRINPECSTQEGHAIYDPCAPGSRLGTTLDVFESFFSIPTGRAEESLLPPLNGRGRGLRAGESLLLDGLHFHTLCEQNSDDLERTLDAVEEKFGKYLHQMKWINFGGGHHITRDDYDIPRLEHCIRRMQERYGLQVYLEPGEAVALNAGTLHSTVLEVQPQGTDGIANVILDTSAACHMPDVIEMPYTPPIVSPQLYRPNPTTQQPSNPTTQQPNNQTTKQLNNQTTKQLNDQTTKQLNDQTTKQLNDQTTKQPYRYRFGGPTCLSGDVIGDYALAAPLHEGDEVVFGDMAIYSMVKTNTFNGMPLPDIYIKKGETLRLWKHFSYDDFKSRL